MNDRAQQLKSVQQEALELFKRKNADYGDAFATYGSIGVIVRIGDKINRLSKITKTGISMVNTESLRDTLIDLHNYSAMAVLLMDEKPAHRRIHQIKSEDRMGDVATSCPRHFGNRVWRNNGGPTAS